MSEFQKFVSYMNLYENNKKLRNGGFARIEIRGAECKLEVHIRGIQVTGTTVPLYLFARKEQSLQGIFLGRLSLMNGNATGRFLVNAENVNDSGYKLLELGGFVILLDQQLMLASQWDDQEILREQLQLPGAGEGEDNQEEKSSEIEFSGDGAPVSEDLQATEAAPQPPQPQVSWQERWKYMLEHYPVFQPFEEDPGVECIRIELKDLRELPKRYWYLGNNSFLLHGFFNYRYLILGAFHHQESTRWFLGVPGIYQSQERVMATIFGFPEYQNEKAAQQKTGQFGYWYRILEE